MMAGNEGKGKRKLARQFLGRYCPIRMTSRLKSVGKELTLLRSEIGILREALRQEDAQQARRGGGGMRPFEDRTTSPRLPLQKAAEYLGISKRTLERIISDRLIPVQKISTRKHFIRVFDLDRYIENHTTKAR